MVHLFDGLNYWLRLDKGEHLKECLEQFLEAEKVDGAWISGIGGALACELGFYNMEKQAYQWQKFTGMREILNLQGTISKNEASERMFHLHGTFGDEYFQTIGGHVKDITVGGTLELFIHRSYQPLSRKTDKAVGLQTLDI